MLWNKFIGQSLLCIFAALSIGCVSVEHQADRVLSSGLTAPLSPIVKKNNQALHDYLVKLSAHNRNLVAQRLTVEALQLTVDNYRAQRLPQVSANFSTAKGSTEDFMAVSDPLLSSLSLDVEWDVDLWGQISDQVKVTQIEMQAESLLLQHNTQQLLAEGIRNYLLLLQLRDDKVHLDEQLRLAKAQLAKAQDCYRSEECDLERVAEQQLSLQQTEIELSNHKLQLIAATHKYNLMIGQKHDTQLPSLNFSKNSIEELDPQTDIGLLLSNRADIQASFNKIKSFDLQAEITAKALLPQVVLSGAVLRFAENPARLWSETSLWRLVGSAGQVLFDGGQIRRTVKQKSLQASIALAEYQGVFATAYAEVALLLQQRHVLNKQQQIVMQNVNNSVRLTRSLAHQFASGALELSSYLMQKQQLNQQQRLLSEYHYQLVRNRIELALALGQYII